MFHLVDEAGANAAAVDFLQRDDVELVQQLGNLAQRLLPSGVRQQMLPATGEVVMITLGVDTDLNVEAQQLQHIR